MPYSPRLNRCRFCGKFLIGLAGDFCNDTCDSLARTGVSVESISPESLDPRLSKSRDDPKTINPIMLEVMKGALISISKEMGNTMVRTAYSPIFYEGNDYTCGLFDDDMELVAQYQGNNSQLGAQKLMVGIIVNEMRDEGMSLNPGDVIIHNDVYRGVPHLPELSLIRPLFYENKLMGFAANIAHHADVGGKSPGSFPGDASEIFQEGILITPVKLFEADHPVSSIFRLILANVRAPEKTYGDLMAMYGSVVTAEKRLQQLLDRHGVDNYLNYKEAIKNYSERRMRREISLIPNGVYEAEAAVDDDGITDRPYYVRVRVKVCDEDLIFDYRESDPQAAGPINSPYSVTYTASVTAILNLVDHTIPFNEGTFRPMHFLLPPGKLINPVWPAPVSGGNTETFNLIASAVVQALSQALPDRVAACGGETENILTLGGYDDIKEQSFITFLWDPGGWGGRYSAAGENATNSYTGTTAKNFSAEVIETEFPLRTIRWQLKTDSGGAGKYRGGLGVIREYELEGRTGVVGGHANRRKFPAPGVFSGQEGSRQHFLFSTDGKKFCEVTDLKPNTPSTTKFSDLKLERGAHIVLEAPGGGGYGPVSDRDQESVEEDLKNGYISLKEAIRTYKLDSKTARGIAKTHGPCLGDGFKNQDEKRVDKKEGFSDE